MLDCSNYAMINTGLPVYQSDNRGLANSGLISVHVLAHLSREKVEIFQRQDSNNQHSLNPMIQLRTS